MSTERDQLKSKVSNTVTVNSFSGGTERGRCLQLAQRYSGTESPMGDIIGYVQLDKRQVEQLIADARKWLLEFSAE